MVKWLPIIITVATLLNNTLAYFYIDNIINDLLEFTFGNSILVVLLMYACSYAFKFCAWHRILITYNLCTLLIALANRYVLFTSAELKLTLYYILLGLTLIIIVYVRKHEQVYIDKSTNVE